MSALFSSNAPRIDVIHNSCEDIPPSAYGGAGWWLYDFLQEVHRRGVRVRLHTTQSSTIPLQKPGRGITVPASDRLLYAGDELTFVNAVGKQLAIDVESQQVPDLIVNSNVLFSAVRRNFPLEGIAQMDWMHNPPLGDTLAPYEFASGLFDDGVRLVPVSFSQARLTAQARLRFDLRAINPHGINGDRFPLYQGPKGMEFGDGVFSEFALINVRLVENKLKVETLEALLKTGFRVAIIARPPNDQEEMTHSEQLKNLASRHPNQVMWFWNANVTTKQFLLSRASFLVNYVEWAEPANMVAREAMAAGLFTVSSKAGALYECGIDGKTGFFCSNFGEYVSALENLKRAGVPDESQMHNRKLVESGVGYYSAGANVDRFFTYAHGLNLDAGFDAFISPGYGTQLYGDPTKRFGHEILTRRPTYESGRAPGSVSPTTHNLPTL